MDKQIKNVVIIGGGYGGIRFLERFHDTPDVQITLIDQNSYHYLQVEAYGFIANRKNITDVSINLDAIVRAHKNSMFLLGKVQKIDFDNKMLHCHDGTSLSYDYLVIASGSRTFFPSTIEGVNEYAHGIKSLRRSFEFKQRFEQTVYNEIRVNGCRTREDFNIVVAGAGLSGVETAAEMAEFAEKILYSSGFFCGDIIIYLIASGKSVLEGMDPYVIATTTERLEKLGVRILTSSRVAKVEKNLVLLENGTNVPSDFLIWTTGIWGSPFVREMDIPKNKKHQILVDEYLRIPNYPNVFVIGDAAELRDREGNIQPSTAQTAEASAAITAVNIRNMLFNKPLVRPDIKNQGVLVAIGGRDAVGIIGKSLKFSGFLAYLFKELIFAIYKIPLKRKSKKGFDTIYHAQ